LIRITGIVAGVCQWRTDEVFWFMPLRLVFSYEHFYYIQQGVDCQRKGAKNSLDDLVKNV